MLKTAINLNSGHTCLFSHKEKEDSLQTHIPADAQTVITKLQLSCSIQLKTCSRADTLLEKNIYINQNQIQPVWLSHSPAPANSPGLIRLCSLHCITSEM